jgi:hypothetical protein
MEVSGQLHATDALPLGKEPLVPTGSETEWGQVAVWTRCRKKKKLFPLPEIEQQSSSL